MELVTLMLEAVESWIERMDGRERLSAICVIMAQLLFKIEQSLLCFAYEFQ